MQGALAGKVSNGPMNQYGLPPKLGIADLTCSSTISSSRARSSVGPSGRSAPTRPSGGHKEHYGTQIATISSQADVEPALTTCAALFNQAKYDYAWWSTLLYGFDVMGWGEPDYAEWGTCEDTLPPHTPPTVPALGSFTTKVLQPILGSGGSAVRRTTTGTIEVDPPRHAGRFLPLVPWDATAPSPTAP